MFIPNPTPKNKDIKYLLDSEDQDLFCISSKCNRECLNGVICLFDSDNANFTKLKSTQQFKKWLKTDLLDWISK